MGHMSFANSETIYDGEWVDGMRQGHGVLTLNMDASHKYEGGSIQNQLGKDRLFHPLHKALVFSSTRVCPFSQLRSMGT